MSVYTVHEPPLRRGENEADPLRFVFVRDGFTFWAFLLGPLWMLRHRLWLVFVGYLVLLGAIAVAFHFARVPGSAIWLVSLLLALLIGFEAASLRRWTLARRGWSNLGVVVADDLEAAERRFFDAWVSGGRMRHAAPASPVAAARAGGPPPDVIDLFPEPGARA